MYAKLLLLTLFVAANLGFKAEGYLKVPPEGLKKVVLVLKDELSGAAKEEYKLDGAKQLAFIKDLNTCEEAPTMKMNITCYRFEVHYVDGRVVQLSTNGKGIGPTPVGYFLSKENLIFKYWPISRDKFCKPTKPDSGGGGTFGF